MKKNKELIEKDFTLVFLTSSGYEGLCFDRTYYKHPVQERVVFPRKWLKDINHIFRNRNVLKLEAEIKEDIQYQGIWVMPRGAKVESTDSGVLISSEKFSMFYSHPFLERKRSEKSIFRCFSKISGSLQKAGMDESKLLRTWFFQKNLLEGYSLLNEARGRWLSRWWVKGSLIPSSTGIQGNMYDGAFSLEFCAFSGVTTRQLYSPIQNEPTEYNKFFSRAACVDLPMNKVLYISGTASTGSNGEVLFPGDIKNQIKHTLKSIRALLELEKGSFNNILSGMFWIKHKEDREICLEIANDSGFPVDLCLIQVDHDVCRDGWLCEIEVTASVMGFSV